MFAEIMSKVFFSFTTSFVLVLLLGNKFIAWLSSQQFEQPVREFMQQSHQDKQGTPAMGGLLLVLVLLLVSLLFADWRSYTVQVFLLTLLGFSIIGFLDDYSKFVNNTAVGVTAKYKYIYQSIVAGLVIYVLYTAGFYANTKLFIPFLSEEHSIELGALYLFCSYFVIVGSSNGYNITDGLDGLVSVIIALVAFGLLLIALLAMNARFAGIFSLPHIAEASNIAMLSASILGISLAFLWFNAYPAKVFLGDIGSLSLGAGLGVLAIMLKQELSFFLLSFVVVLEVVSVILQVASYKVRGKKIFKMAPLHHHFELLGMQENTIVVRFWLVSLLCLIITLFVLLFVR